MLTQLVEWGSLLLELSFWESLLAQFQYLGPLAPILLAGIESLIPALPLVAIVLLNVTAHGLVLGFLYSWVGACVGSFIVFFFFRKVVQPHFSRFVARFPKLQKAQDWVDGINPAALFLIAIMPFTPSSFLNVAFGVSGFSARKYLCTILCAKVIMISLLALFGQSFVAAFTQPWVIVITIGLFVGLYAVSKKINQKYNL